MSVYERPTGNSPAELNRGFPGSVPMLVPSNAWRILNARTGGTVSRPTFYRWLASGKLFSIRVGHRMYIPWPALDEMIKQCLAGERI
jgi:excisionase family DNA binding protein